METIVLAVYITIIAGLVWARYKYFKLDSKPSRMSSLFYDPIVAIHIASTAIAMALDDLPNLLTVAFSMSLMIIGFGTFIASIRLAKSLDFAFSDSVDKLITSGTYGIVRHPLYLSYLLIWAGGTIITNALLSWITMCYLLAFYVISARKEEKILRESKYSREYSDYCQNVGMFLPRIKEWKS